MTTLAWSDRYVSGHPTIDAQHQAIFAALDGLADACSDGGNPAAIGHFLDLCREHIVHHFRDEEAEMARIGYPAEAIGKHRRAHAQVAEAVFALIEAEAKGDIISAPQALRVGQLMASHIKVEDVPFIDAARAVWRPAPAAARPAKTAAAATRKPAAKQQPAAKASTAAKAKPATAKQGGRVVAAKKQAVARARTAVGARKR